MYSKKGILFHFKNVLTYLRLQFDPLSNYSRTK